MSTAYDIVNESMAGSDFAELLRVAGRNRYHHRHPFNRLMHAGRLTLRDLRLWVANRYYYQTRIPIKDALIVGKSEDRHFRSVWTRRLLDHDGRTEPKRHATPGPATPGPVDFTEEGGLELWMKLGEGVGLSRDDLERHRWLLPSVKAICDEYVDFVRNADLLSAVAATLTEYFAGSMMKARLRAFRRHYPFVQSSALAYFTARVEQSRKDAAFALTFVSERSRTDSDRERCLAAFEQKCSILWRLLDAIYLERRRTLRPKLARRASLASTKRPHLMDTDQRPLLLAPEKALRLSRSAASLLALTDGRRTLIEIARVLSEAYVTPLETIEGDIATFVGELECQRLLAFRSEDAGA